jgi:hypothetical protein
MTGTPESNKSKPVLEYHNHKFGWVEYLCCQICQRVFLIYIPITHAHIHIFGHLLTLELVYQGFI